MSNSESEAGRRLRVFLPETGESPGLIHILLYQTVASVVVQIKGRGSHHAIRVLSDSLVGVDASDRWAKGL